MKIRKFRESDRACVIQLWGACELTRPWNNPDSDIDRKLQFQPDYFFVGTKESQLVASAMAGYDGHRGSVFYLAVHPDFQGQGYGQILMAHIEVVLLEAGCPKLNILVRSSNVAVLGFYESSGYAIDEVASLGKRLIPDV